jgi:hypothetical protein
MDINEILQQLEAEHERLTTAIAALNGQPKSRRGYGKRKTTGTMSASARKRISIAQKARWKAQKAQAED